MAIKVTENILIFLLITVGELISSRTEIVFIILICYHITSAGKIRFVGSKLITASEAGCRKMFPKGPINRLVSRDFYAIAVHFKESDCSTLSDMRHPINLDTETKLVLHLVEQ